LNEYVTPSPPGIATPPTVVLLDTSCFYVIAPIDEVDAPAVKINMDARVIMDAFGNKHFPARVRRIDPYVLDLEKQARTVDVEVEFVDEEAEEAEKQESVRTKAGTQSLESGLSESEKLMGAGGADEDAPASDAGGA